MMKSTKSCITGAFTLMTWESKHRTHPLVFRVHNFWQKTSVQLVQPIKLCKYCHITSEDNFYLGWTMGNFLLVFSGLTLEFWLIFWPFSFDGLTGPWVLTDILLVSFNFWAAYFCIPCHHNASALENVEYFAKWFAPHHTLSSLTHSKYTPTQWF